MDKYVEAARRARSGEIDFAQFVSETKGAWERWAHRMARGSEVDDARQELLIEAWLALDQTTSENPWMFLRFVTRRRAQRKFLRRRCREEVDGVDRDIECGGDMEARMAAAEELTRLWDLCERGRERRAFQVVAEENGVEPPPVTRGERQPYGPRAVVPPSERKARKIVANMVRELRSDGLA